MVLTAQALVHDALEVITFPAAAARVLQLLDDPDVHPSRIAEALALDPPLASRVLRIANSPFFLGRAPIDELPRAVMVLGTALLRDLVLGVAAVKAFQSADISDADLEAYWSQSIRCGSIAAEIALVSSRRLAEVAFTCGLMHDLGELVLLIRRPDEMQEIRAKLAANDDGADAVPAASLRAAEAERFGFDHTDVGAALAAAWHFPDTLVQCMSFHHSPGDASDDYTELVSIIHVAIACVPLIDESGVVVPSQNALDPDDWSAAGIEPADLPGVLERARERIDAMQAALL